jgi:putative ribosome biogenesis GTPase RsgA
MGAKRSSISNEYQAAIVSTYHWHNIVLDLVRKWCIAQEQRNVELSIVLEVIGSAIAVKHTDARTTRIVIV